MKYYFANATNRHDIELHRQCTTFRNGAAAYLPAWCLCECLSAERRLTWAMIARSLLLVIEKTLCCASLRRLQIASARLWLARSLARAIVLTAETLAEPLQILQLEGRSRAVGQRGAEYKSCNCQLPIARQLPVVSIGNCRQQSPQTVAKYCVS